MAFVTAHHRGPVPHDRAALARALAVKARHAADLLAYPGVVAVGVGFRFRGGRLTDELCIGVTTVRKRAPERLTPGELLPAELEGVPVDVTEGDPVALAGPPKGPAARAVTPPRPTPAAANGMLQTQALAVLEAHRAELAALPGVTGTGLGLRQHGGGARGEAPGAVDETELVIALHVEAKKPLAEVPHGERLPTEVEGVRTDVVTHRITGLQADKSYYATLQGGINIGKPLPGPPGFLASGTLGCLARDRATQQLLVLSNWHVLCGSEDWASKDRTIIQPGPTTTAGTGGGPGFGTVLRGFFNDTVDAAVCSVDARSADAYIREIGTVAGSAGCDLGDRIRKRGATTQLTYGVIIEIGFTHVFNIEGGATHAISGAIGVRPTDDTYDTTQIAWSSNFSQGGDSGSVYVNEENYVVALHFAGYGGIPGQLGYIPGYSQGGAGCAIGAVCDQLNIDIATTGSYAPPPPSPWAPPPTAPPPGSTLPPVYVPPDSTPPWTPPAPGEPYVPPPPYVPVVPPGMAPGVTTRRLLLGGISTGACSPNPFGKPLSATLGCIVKDRATGAHLALTEGHVVCSSGHFNSPTTGDHVLNPALAWGGSCPSDDYGVVVRSFWDARGDASVCSIDETKRRVECRIDEIGRPTGAADPELGTTVRKRGMTTGLTKGVITRVGVSVAVGSILIGVSHFEDQIEIKDPLNFAVVKGGDSGSVFVDEHDRVVALLTAGTDDDDPGQTVRAAHATPIHYVLDGLGVDICTDAIPPPDALPPVPPGEPPRPPGSGGAGSDAGGGDPWVVPEPLLGAIPSDSQANSYGGFHWVESGDSKFPLEWPRVEFLRGSYEQVAGYTPEELPYTPYVLQAADPSDPEDDTQTVYEDAHFQYHPDGYQTKAYHFPSGGHVTLGGMNVEDPPGYPQFDKEPGVTVLTWPRMASPRVAHAVWADEAFFAAVVKLDGGETCLWRGFALTHSDYQRGGSWQIYRENLVDLWVTADGAVEVRKADGSLAVSKDGAKVARSAPGVVPFGRWFHFQLQLVLDYVGQGHPSDLPFAPPGGYDPDDHLAWGGIGVTIDETVVIGKRFIENNWDDLPDWWQLNPCPGEFFEFDGSTPYSYDRRRSGLLFSGCDFGSVEGGGVTLRDISALVYGGGRGGVPPGQVGPVWAPTPGHWAYTVYEGEVHLSDQIAADSLLSPGGPGHYPTGHFKALAGTLVAGGHAWGGGTDEVTPRPEPPATWSVEDFRPTDVKIAAVGMHHPTEAELNALGWAHDSVYGLGGYSWIGVQGSAVDTKNAWVYREEFIASWYASSDVAHIPFHQPRREEKSGNILWSVPRYRGQPGLEGRVLALRTGSRAAYTAFVGANYDSDGRPMLGTEVVTEWTGIMFSFQNESDFGGWESHIGHGPVIHRDEAPDTHVRAPTPVANTMNFVFVDSFGHYRTEEIGAATTIIDPSDGKRLPVYGLQSANNFGAKSTKWPTAIGTCEVQRPGRWGKDDGMLMVQGAASCVLRDVWDCDADTGGEEEQIGFSYRCDPPSTWPAGTDFVRVLTLMVAHNPWFEWPPQVQMTVELDRSGYLWINRKGGPFVHCANARDDMRSAVPIDHPEEWHFLELRFWITQADYPPSNYQWWFTHDGYATIAVDGEVVGDWQGVRMCLDDGNTLGHAHPWDDGVHPVDTYWEPEEAGDDWNHLLLGGDYLYPTDGQTTVKQWYDDLYLASLWEADPYDPYYYPVQWLNKVSIIPLYPEKTDFRREGDWDWTGRTGGAEPHTAVNQKLPDGDPTQLWGPLSGDPLPHTGWPMGFKLPHIYDPEADGLKPHAPRFIGFQSFGSMRSDAPLSGVGSSYEYINTAVPNGQAFRLQDPEADPPPEIYFEQDGVKYGWIGTLWWSRDNPKTYWCVMHGEPQVQTPAFYIPRPPFSLTPVTYDFSPKQFNLMRFGPDNGHESGKMTQFGIEVLGTLPVNRQFAQLVRTPGAAPRPAPPAPPEPEPEPEPEP